MNHANSWRSRFHINSSSKGFPSTEHTIKFTCIVHVFSHSRIIIVVEWRWISTPWHKARWRKRGGRSCTMCNLKWMTDSTSCNHFPKKTESTKSNFLWLNEQKRTPVSQWRNAQMGEVDKGEKGIWISEGAVRSWKSFHSFCCVTRWVPGWLCYSALFLSFFLQCIVTWRIV